MTVRLAAAGWEAELRPEIGGALSALRLDGIDVLRPMAHGAVDPLQSSCFPLVPYCNRIKAGAFAWQGEAVQLPRNFPPETSSLHGMGWQVPWQVVHADAFRCTLAHQHAGLGPRPWKSAPDTWPWAYVAQQRVRLGPQGLKVTLDLTNLSNGPMPAGLGLHPYFRRSDETAVRFSSRGMVRVDESLIPAGDFVPAATFADWAAGTPLPDVLVDHCFVDWGGKVEIVDAAGTIAMRATGAPDLHVYAPADGSALCFEPVSHTPDALNQAPAAMITLPPGCTASLTMEISASA